MEWTVDGNRLPQTATSLLLATGALAFVASVAVFVVSLPAGVVSALPADYRVLLAVLSVGGGLAHVIAGVWARQRRSLFGIVTATLVGMVLLQISAPVDILVVVLLALSREEFEDSDW